LWTCIPLTFSVYPTGTTATSIDLYPSENSPSWSIIGYISSSQNSGGGVKYPLSTQMTSGSYFFYKVRGANGTKIHTVGLIDSGSTFMLTDKMNSNSYTVSVPLESKQILFGVDLTQSIGTTNVITLNPTISPFGGFGQNILYIYTGSNSFPLPSDSKWTTVTYYPSTEFVRQTGSYYYQDIGAYVSQSNYYYFKFNTPNGTIMNISTASIYDISSGSINYVTSSNMVRCEFTKSVQTDNAFINFAVGN